jgi:hypothetical protein
MTARLRLSRSCAHWQPESLGWDTDALAPAYTAEPEGAEVAAEPPIPVAPSPSPRARQPPWASWPWPDSASDPGLSLLKAPATGSHWAVDRHDGPLAAGA